MPRKRVLGPATAKQVLTYFQQVNQETVEVIYDLVTEIVRERRLMNSQRRVGADDSVGLVAVPRKPRKPRGPKQQALPETTPPSAES